ncbi:hypothetical protein ABLN97_20605, partial [Mycobacterium tuberculosis]
MDVPGLGQIALNSAPIFGGAMLAIAAGQFKGPDFRALIRQDMDLIDRLPADATKRRANRPLSYTNTQAHETSLQTVFTLPL